MSPASDLRCAVHEIGHTLGMLHEHQRSDRDNYIDIFRENLNWSDRKFNTNFAKVGRSYGLYDPNSIMHYGSFLTEADAIDPSKPVLLEKSGRALTRKTELSLGDLRGRDFLYGDLPDYSPPTNVRIETITSNSAVCRWDAVDRVLQGFYYEYSVTLSKVVQSSPFENSELLSIVEANRFNPSFAFYNLDSDSRYKCVVNIKNGNRKGDESTPALFNTKTSVNSSTSGSSGYTKPTSSTTGQGNCLPAGPIDSNGNDADGWGWDGTESCSLSHSSTSSTGSNGGSQGNNLSCHPAGPVDASGNDADGWGWNGTASCVL